ncbi:MAG: hypothetical protein IJG30_00440, partial [Synergistaceae bacterium]|nr:hypothetical protein [Synergistaceae bacterium]
MRRKILTGIIITLIFAGIAHSDFGSFSGNSDYSSSRSSSGSSSSYSSSSSSSYSTKELFDMTLESLKYDVSNNTAYVRGVGRIADNSPSSLLLARRAALVDAQRGMLLIKKSIKDFRGVKNVSGHVPALRLLSESTRDGLYFVEVEAAL